MLSMFIWLSNCYTEVNGKKKNDIMVISKADTARLQVQ